ncbi:glyoxalase superfamily protein [Sulfitobacter sp.]|uniref:glyoxalase superfamily protein n=1 Tax=Sulfitobacter sp. TaxID=1903071 RepID=UPI00300398E0
MTQIPSRDVLKAQAKRLRAELGAKGTEMTHAAALETVAHQWGMRDWNTLAAKADVSALQWHPGKRVSGRYLGHPFRGMIKAASLSSSGYWSLTVRFDAPVDVVESKYFTSLRQQVNTKVNATGESPQKTSNGQPHMVVGPE